MQFNDDTLQEENPSLIKKLAPLAVWLVIIGITVYFIKDQEIKAAAGRDIIRCIIDENASDLGSPACKRVINICSNDTTGVCKKLLFYSDYGVHSNDALLILGDICSKGGEQACDILINRCIEDSTNCEVLGKSYSIKTYLSMNPSVKNTGKNVMYKKLKNYYEKDVDNIVNSVIETCIDDKNTMACQIFTSKTYKFNPDEKSYFDIIQDSARETVFSDTGVTFAHVVEKNKKEKIEEENKLSDDFVNNNEEKEKSVKSSEVKTAENLLTASKEEKSNKSRQETENRETENSSNIELSLEADDKKLLAQKQHKAVFKSILVTGEGNNVDYIKNKVYSFNVEYKEPENTKIKWLVSFDGKVTWKKWNGSEWVQTNTVLGLEKINFSEVGNTSSEIIKGLKDYVMQQGETSLDFAVELISHDEILTPAVSKVEIKYH